MIFLAKSFRLTAHALAIFALSAAFAVPVAGQAAPVPAATAPTKGGVTEEDTLIRGARECTRHMPLQEQKYNIPQHLLMAIGSNESGRYHDGLKAVVPWPWTVNAAGKGFYFASKAEAVAAVRRFQSEGITSIDVGCMQVNLKHHPKAFTSLQNAFEPEANVAYAARFLRTNFESAKSWLKAVAYYHSQTPKYGTPYAQGIYKRWQTVLSRGGITPADAMAAVGSAATTQEIAALQADLATPKKTLERPRSGTAAQTKAASAPIQTARYEAPKMKVIRVYKDQPSMQMMGLSEPGALRMDHGVKVASAAPAAGGDAASSGGARLSMNERAEVSAVSSMIVQDIAESNAAYGTRTERGVEVSRGFAPTAGQFTPRQARLASGDDGSFVMQR